MGAAFVILLVAPLLAVRPADLALLRDRLAVVVLTVLAGAAIVFVAGFVGTLLTGSEGEMDAASQQMLGAMLVLAAPVGTAAPLLAGLTGGNVMLARAILIASMIPPAFLAPMFFGLNPIAGIVLLAILVSPLLLGLARPQIAARVASPAATLAPVVTLGLAGAVVWQTGLAGAGRATLIAAAMLGVLWLAGRALGTALGLNESDRRAAVLALMTRNLGLGLAVALGMELPAMGVPIVIFGLLMWLAGLAPLALRRRA